MMYGLQLYDDWKKKKEICCIFWGFLFCLFYVLHFVLFFYLYLKIVIMETVVYEAQKESVL